MLHLLIDIVVLLVMHFQLIKVIDQMRMLDQDLIRLQQKVDVVLEYKENEKKKRGEVGKDEK